MTSFESYVFILCLIVLVMSALVFGSMILLVAKQGVRLIELGADDKRLYKKHLKALKRGHEEEQGWFSQIITAIFLCVVLAVFGFTVFIQSAENKVTTDIPTLRVVYSDSMSDKYELNKYLFDNDLNDQFSRFDLIVTYQLPKEEDLQLYDIVVYEVDDVLLIHRIIEIEEPNEKHPNERYFRLQGDLVEYPDKFPVRYSQMKAIYRGERVQYVGSFIMFLQSPVGYMCFIFLVVEMFTSPLVTKRITKAEKARIRVLTANKRNLYNKDFNGLDIWDVNE